MASKRQRKKNVSKAVSSPKTAIVKTKQETYECLSSEQNMYYQQLEDINYVQLFNNANIYSYYTRQEIEHLISQPMVYNESLRRISRILYNANGIYTNTVDYMEALHTLQHFVHVTGSKPDVRQKYKKQFKSALDAIDHKRVIRDALHKGMVDGVAFYYCESEPIPYSHKTFLNDFDMGLMGEINQKNTSISMIPLPTDYTKIYQIIDGHYQICFNMEYILLGDEPVEHKLRVLPKEIREAYEKWNKGENVGGGNWVPLNHNKTVVHKIRSELREQWGRPLCLAAIKDILYSDYFTDTKRNILNDINSEVWIQTFPEGDQKGQTTLTRKQQEHQHNTVSNSIKRTTGKNEKTVISIMAGTKIEHVPATNTDILDDKYESNLDEKIAMYLGIAASLLSGTGSGSYSTQQNNLQLVSSQLFEWVEQISKELNKVLNYALNPTRSCQAEVVYLPVTFINKKESISNFKDLYTMGKGPITLWVTASGIDMDTYIDLIKEENEVLDWNNETLFPIHKTSFNTSGDTEESKAGRPVEENPTDSTITNRAYNGNDIPSPSD